MSNLRTVLDHAGKPFHYYPQIARLVRSVRGGLIVSYILEKTAGLEVAMTSPEEWIADTGLAHKDRMFGLQAIDARNSNLEKPFWITEGKGRDSQYGIDVEALGEILKLQSSGQQMPPRPALLSSPRVIAGRKAIDNLWCVEYHHDDECFQARLMSEHIESARNRIGSFFPPSVSVVGVFPTEEKAWAYIREAEATQ